jgi:hypothetical protein
MVTQVLSSLFVAGNCKIPQKRYRQRELEDILIFDALTEDIKK